MSLIYNLLGLKISGLISTYFILNGLNSTSYENELFSGLDCKLNFIN